MKPAPFDYHAPDSLDEALALLGRLGDGARLLAGGQSLVPLLNMRLARPEALIDLNGIAALSTLEIADGELRIGAMVRHMTLERDPDVRRHVPLVAEAARHIAHLQIRTRGTIGGSLANAASAAEWPAAIAALDGRLVVRGAAGERVLDTDSFFAGPMTTTLGDDELLTEIRVPVPAPGTGHAFVEFARRHGDFALAGAAVLVVLADDGTIGSLRLAVCGMADPGTRLRTVEAAMAGRRWDAATAGDLAAAVREAVDAPADVQLSAQSRREVAGVIARRALDRAVARARGKEDER